MTNTVINKSNKPLCTKVWRGRKTSIWIKLKGFEVLYLKEKSCDGVWEVYRLHHESQDYLDFPKTQSKHLSLKFVSRVSKFIVIAYSYATASFISWFSSHCSMPLIIIVGFIGCNCIYFLRAILQHHHSTSFLKKEKTLPRTSTPESALYQDKWD